MSHAAGSSPIQDPQLCPIGAIVDTEAFNTSRGDQKFLSRNDK
jgi:hypothetical protein